MCMISAEAATNTLLQVNKGEYKPGVFSTTNRTFTPSYPKQDKPFLLDLLLYEPRPT